MTRKEITKAIKSLGWKIVRWDDPVSGAVSVSDKGGYWYEFARTEAKAELRLSVASREEPEVTR